MTSTADLTEPAAVLQPEPYTWPKRRPFLSAQWRHLAMLNFRVDPATVEPLAPAGTEIDFHGGHTYASIVGFLFLETRVLGAAIPGHVNFEEVNLRFYVRRKSPEGWRRGVAFVRELVPRRAIAIVANTLFGEKYASVPMKHRLEFADGVQTRLGDERRVGPPDPPQSLHYGWKFHGQEQWLQMQLAGPAAVPPQGSLDQFIAEHYWGYAARRNGSATEYQVAHPRWRVCPASSCRLRCDVERLYGKPFAEALSAEPESAFWAEGSAVRVYRGRRIR